MDEYLNFIMQNPLDTGIGVLGISAALYGAYLLYKIAAGVVERDTVPERKPLVLGIKNEFAEVWAQRSPNFQFFADGPTFTKWEAPVNKHAARDRYLTWCKNNPSPFSLAEKVRIKILGMNAALREKKADHKRTEAKLSRDHSAEMRESLERTTATILKSHNTISKIEDDMDDLRNYIRKCSKAGK